MTQKPGKNIRDKAVMAQFEARRRKLSWLAILIGVIVGAISLMAYQNGLSKPMTAGLLAASFAWALIVHVKIWRCPSCNGHLGRLYFGLKLPKYCPHCGIRLVDEKSADQ